MRNIVLPKQVRLIIDVLERNGFEGYAVGGCVRDVMLGRQPKDWDITTNALPYQVKELFHRTIDTGIKHGTVTVMMNHVGYEVTTYRIDGEYEDGRHPSSVEFTSNLIEDLKRRDFTINAMAYNEKRGLVDEFCGLLDLEKGIIRCVGNPYDRFNEDALRIMRAVRFAGQLGFTVDAETKKAITDLADNLRQISKERIQAELVKLVTSDNPGIIREAYETGITKVVLPEFDDMMNTNQNSIYHAYNVGEHTIKVLEAVRPDKYLRLAALFHDIGKPKVHTADEEGKDHFHGHEQYGSEMAADILKRLKFDNKTIEIVSKLTRFHDYPLRPDEKIIRRSINKIGSEIYPMFLELRMADLAGKSEYSKEQNTKLFEDIQAAYEEVCRQNACISMKDLNINGRDLIELGVPRGERIGDVLNELLEMVLDNPELNEKEVLIDIAKKMI